MRLTQMLAVLNGEVRPEKYSRLSHYDPDLEKRIKLKKILKKYEFADLRLDGICEITHNDCYDDD